MLDVRVHVVCMYSQSVAVVSSVKMIGHAQSKPEAEPGAGTSSSCIDSSGFQSQVATGSLDSS